MTRRRLFVAVLGVLLAGVLGCSSGAGPASTSTTPAVTTSPAPRADADTALCQRFTTAAGTLRGVLDTAQQAPVLGPAVYLLLLNPRNLAATPGITDPQLAAAMRELVAALDELATQAQTKLPGGADPAKTPVQLDTTRASSALTAAEAACRPRLSGIVPSR